MASDGSSCVQYVQGASTLDTSNTSIRAAVASKYTQPGQSTWTTQGRGWMLLRRVDFAVLSAGGCPKSCDKRRVLRGIVIENFRRTCVSAFFRLSFCRCDLGALGCAPCLGLLRTSTNYCPKEPAARWFSGYLGKVRDTVACTQSVGANRGGGEEHASLSAAASCCCAPLGLRRSLASKRVNMLASKMYVC